MNSAIHPELQSDIQMGRFEKGSEGQLDSTIARDRMFAEVQTGLLIQPIYKSPENPGKNPEVSSMLNHFSIDMTNQHSDSKNFVFRH